jgi:hypothetical protein
MLACYICIASLFLVGYASNIEYPYDYILPKLSGIKSVWANKADGTYYYTFSGSTDANNFTPNMMIEGPYTVMYSNTYYYPSDRSYYGMAHSIDSDDNEVIIVFGGIGKNGVYGDIWSYKIYTDAWTKLNFELPEPLYDFAYTYGYNENTGKTIIYIVGGINNINVFVKNTYK